MHDAQVIPGQEPGPGPQALKKEWVLRTTLTNCPENVKIAVEKLWRKSELFNNAAYDSSINSLLERGDPDFQPIIDYLRQNNIEESEPVTIIRWW